MAYPYRQILPLRLLNDQRGIFGLWMTDFAAGIAIFMLGSAILDGTGYELICLPAAFIVLMGLSPIRLTNRRKIVRDWLAKQIQRRVLHDPRYKRPS